MRTIYYTAVTLDGFLADEQDSLDWLFVQDDQGQGFDYDEFIGNVGAVVTGATTYDWVRANHDGPWPYEQPTFVFSHTGRVADEPHVHSVAGEVREHWAAIHTAASGKNVWVVGGGDLAAQFAEAGHLDQLWLSIAPVTLGAGRPLLPRPRDLELVECRKAGDFICAVYNVGVARRS